MRDGAPSATARSVAAYRLGFDRIAAPSGDPAADERLACDVAGTAAVRSEPMARYLRARTAFFDRVVVNALDRGVRQVLTVGAGYDGRALRYARRGVRWFESDHPDTQRDKRARLGRLGIAAPGVTFVPFDLREAGLAGVLTAAGYQPDAPSLVICEGVAVYLDEQVLGSLLGELRAVAAIGTRLALSLRPPVVSAGQAARLERFEAAVAGLGEPALSSVSPENAGALLAGTRWRAVELSERSRRVGFVVAAPAWLPPDGPAQPPTTGALGRYLERTFHRDGSPSLPEHLEDSYGIRVSGIRELDVGVFRVDRADGPSWAARVFPAARPVGAAADDAELLRWLERTGFPAERCAHPDPVSTHRGQAVLVTGWAAGRKAAGSQRTFHALGDLLGRLHTLEPGPPAAMRPGGGWHHLVFDGGPREEIAAAAALLREARHRVPAGQGGLYDVLAGELADADDCHDLPAAVTHPDLVPSNLIACPDGPVVIDWNGAGWGPRLPSLGFLLWAAGTRGPKLVDAVVAGYRAHTGPEPSELDRLPGAIAARPLVLSCWEFATGREQLPTLVERSQVACTAAEEIAARARAAFRQPPPAP